MKDRDIQIMIEKYIREKLSDIEEDELWIEFLRAPEWYEYFLTELH